MEEDSIHSKNQNELFLIFDIGCSAGGGGWMNGWMDESKESRVNSGMCMCCVTLMVHDYPWPLHHCYGYDGYLWLDMNMNIHGASRSSHGHFEIYYLLFHYLTKQYKTNLFEKYLNILYIEHQDFKIF